MPNHALPIVAVSLRFVCLPFLWAICNIALLSMPTAGHRTGSPAGQAIPKFPTRNKVLKSGAIFDNKKDAATHRVFTTKRHPITTFPPAETHLFKGYPY
jgi:hypothetical protein